jgi:antitoxin (DNA-binding transcriptional repressor) of toxin-antitoxin stability system
VKTIKLSQASRPLSEYAADLRDEIVVLTEGNRAVAAIVPLKKADRESVALSGHPEFLKIIERSRADFRNGRVMSLEAMKNELNVRQSPDTYRPSGRQGQRSSLSGRRAKKTRDRKR